MNQAANRHQLIHGVRPGSFHFWAKVPGKIKLRKCDHCGKTRHFLDNPDGTCTPIKDCS